jgi:predicted nucleic acid-binding protein
VCQIAIVTSPLIQNALSIKEKYGFSYFDCLVIASALEMKCKFLYTEDLQDNQIIENTLIVKNPFL